MRHNTGICINFLDMWSNCGLIILDRVLNRNWQLPLIYLEYLQLKVLVISKFTKTHEDVQDRYDSSAMLTAEIFIAWSVPDELIYMIT